MDPKTLFTFAGETIKEGYAEFAPVQPDVSAASLERRYTNAESAFVEVGDARIHYRSEGDPDDPTVVLVHGTYSSLHTWDGWTARLADSFHVVRFDLPGFGLTGPRADGEHSFEYLIDTVGRLCERLELEDVAVAGNSLGGSIGWRVAVDRPDLVDRLVLVDAGGPSILARYARLLRAVGTDLTARFLTPRLLVRLLLEDAYAEESTVTPSVVQRYHDLLLGPGNRRAVIEIAETIAAEYPDAVEPATPAVPTLPSGYEPSVAVPDGYDLADVPVPTLFQWGEEDEWLPVELGRKRAESVPDSRFISYEGIGHAPMEERPESTVADTIEFLDG